MNHIFVFLIRPTGFFQKCLLCLYFLVIASLSSCSHADDIDWDIKKSINDSIYIINNKLAKERMAKIESQYNAEGCFKLVHISDPHLSEFSESNHYSYPINLIQSVKFANQTDLNINAMVATGDFISNHKDKEIAIKYLQSFTKYFYNNNHIPSFICTGNHDSNIIDSSFSTYITASEIFQNLSSVSCFGLRSQKTNQNYYYTDIPNPQGGYIRIISLDMLDQTGQKYNTVYYVSYTQEQINWLGNTALKKGMSNQHNIIILNHYPFQPHSNNATTYLCDGDFVHDWNMIPDIVEAFRNRTKIKSTYKNQLSTNDSISVNFDFTDSSGQFICYLGGHAHCFAYFNVLGLSVQTSLPHQQMILCSNQAPSEAGVVYNLVKRQEDTISSNSFNIYYIDTQNKKIYITFFGAYQPENNSSYPEIIVLPYS